MNLLGNINNYFLLVFAFNATKDAAETIKKILLSNSISNINQVKKK